MSLLNVAVIWHMHQPDYRDPVTGSLSLPWVRLHALKGYYDMLRVLERAHDDARAVFNFVPSLIAQMNGYLDGTLTDEYLRLSRKPVGDLSAEERQFVTENFFHANRRTMIDCYPRYAELRSRSRLPSGGVRRLSDDELRDLIVWFNLTWCGYSARRDFPLLQELVRQGYKFGEDQKNELLDVQLEVMKAIYPAYRKAAERGQIELTTTPYYHPILPLLCTTDDARLGLPDRDLPKPPFTAPEDAHEHLRRARELFKETFGSYPAGMWPAEGSLSPRAVGIFAEHDVSWIATDQDILFRSDASLKPTDLYRPYSVGEDGKTVTVLFRDRDIADSIGFRYGTMPPKSAADDFMNKLRAIWKRLSDTKEPSLVTIVLDGENAWEYYSDGGEGFLTYVYQVVARSEDFHWTTVSEYLVENPPESRIRKVFPGSWIGGNFDIWIGSDEENRAWTALRETREALVAAESKLDERTRSAAWEHLYAAEGSDWFWWFGDDFTTALQGEFDRLFRARLTAVYHLIGDSVPRVLRTPIRRGRGTVGKPPTDLISPTLDGRSTTYYEWVGAGSFNTEKADSAMARGGRAVEAIYYGADRRHWYLRVDTTNPPTDPAMEGASVVCEFPARPNLRLVIGPLRKEAGDVPVALFDGENRLRTGRPAVARSVIECAVPLLLLDFAPGSPCEFTVALQKAEEEIERWPRDGLLSFTIPSDDFELDHWTV